MPVWKRTENSIENTLNSCDNIAIGCVIMASGLGKRFGGNKLLEDLGGKPLVQWILDTTSNLFEERIVVTRSEEVKQLCERYPVKVILHSEPGRNDTVRLGLEQMAEQVSACFFIPADQPFISKNSFLNLLNAVKAQPEFIWRSAYQTRVGAPVCFPKRTFPELLTLPEGKGGSVVVKKYADAVRCVQVSEEAELEDIDTIEDLQKAKEYLQICRTKMNYD